jgi:hypothetical protein
MKSAFATFLFCALSLQATEWKPISAEDLALKQGRVDPQADAEVLLLDVSISDEAVNGEYPETVYAFYTRLKIFTDRGVKNFQAPDIEYTRHQHVAQVAGRTIQSDGTEQEVAKSAIIDHVLEKRKGFKERAVSLAMPNVKPGTIIEYRWRETHEDELANNVALPAGREIPVEHVVYHVKPLSNPFFPFSMRCQAFGTKIEPFKPEPHGFFTTGLDNIPAFKEEEDSPPSNDVLPWLLIYYMPDKSQSADDFWKSEAKERYGWYKIRTKVNGDVKSTAQTVTAGAKSPGEQIRLLYEYCQKNIKDLRGPDVSDTEHHKVKDVQTSADTLKSGAGYPADIEIAFTALAEAAGFTARPAYVADREIKFFHKGLTNPYFLPARDVAVNIDGTWRLYDLRSRYVQPGHVRWQEEGVLALVLDDKNPTWIEVPIGDAAASHVTRTASLKLNDDGSVEGPVTEMLTGHPEEEWRALNVERSPAQREEHFRNSLNHRFGAAEITNIALPDPADLTKPVILRCHLKADGYATRTGKRLMFAPAFFETNLPARYEASERQNAIYIRYGWSETEDIVFEIPKGFALDHPDAPGPLHFPPFFDYKVKILASSERITFHREFSVADKGTNVQTKDHYQAVKQVFDALHTSDTHLLTLKTQSAGGTPVAQTTSQ